MSKALDKAQTDLDALKAELEAWIASQPPVTVKPAPKPAVKRTRAQLIESATAAPVVATVDVDDVDTSWLDILDRTPSVAAPAVTAPPKPLYTDGRHLVRIRVSDPKPPKLRDRMRAAYSEAYRIG